MSHAAEEKTILQWHPAFYAGIRISFEQDEEALVFENEHQLGTKPREIDVLIIKKSPSFMIKKDIGQIFRTHNIVEYKSPKDYLSIDDFYIVYAYACLYKADTKHVDEVKADEITITFVCQKRPRKLLKHLKKHRGIYTEGKEGIYYLKGDFFPMQLIITSELSEEENFWLKYLTDDIKEAETAKKITERYENHSTNSLYKSVMELIVRANSEVFKEASEMCDALKEIFRESFEKEFESERIQERERGCAQTLTESINNLIANLGLSLEAACQAIGTTVQNYEESKALLEK